MSVWKVREIFKGRKGGLSEGVERKYTRVFQVFTNSKLDGPIEAIFASDGTESIPELYSSYADFGGSTDILAICRSIDPVQDDDDWTIWTVTCEYSTESPRGDQAGQLSPGNSPGDPRTGGGATGDPTLEPPREEWSSWWREVAQEYEAPETDADVADQRPILNSAHTRFDPMPTRELSGDVLIIERNESVGQYNPFLNSLYRNHVNEDDFVWTDDWNEWLCKAITASKVWKGNYQYYRVRYEFHHCGFEMANMRDNDGGFICWDHGLLDAGFEKVLDGKRQPIRAQGDIVPSPWPLDGTGLPLTEAEIEAGDRVTLGFRKYSRVSFTPLNIILE